MAYQESGLYIIPELSLACSGQSIVNRDKVEGIIGGELLDTDRGDMRQFLTITWWQRIGKGTYNLTAMTTITELKPINGHPNVYYFRLNMNDDMLLNVTAGNVLGIRINTRIFNLYYDANRRGIMNHRAVLDSNPIGIPGTLNVSTDTHTVIRGAPLLSFGDRGIVTIMYQCSV